MEMLINLFYQERDHTQNLPMDGNSKSVLSPAIHL